ncbi:response regulator [Chitinophaga sp.]|uniref:response regulator n=1 Tax=Chitinophaga sp. TaxID=1869181 RepID=UPI002F9558BC
MIKKVLIAEDHQSVNISVEKTLEELGIDQTDYVYYCDDALARIQKGVKDDQSYDLLITDLNFKEDTRVQKIPGGLELIPAVRQVQPDLRIIVFSVLCIPSTIEMLFEKLDIDGYVCKGRNDVKALKEAIETVAKNQRYIPRHLTQNTRQKNVHDFTEYDIKIITLLANGMRQKDIPAYLVESGTKPSGLSSIEKRLNYIKETLEFTKNEQLIAFCKDMGII